jgi:hypothetical protein
VKTINKSGPVLFAVDTDKTEGVPKGRVRAEFVRFESLEFEEGEFSALEFPVLNLGSVEVARLVQVIAGA